MANIKQVGLAMMGYVQDNDERFPPATGLIRLSDGQLHEQQWGSDTQNDSILIPGIIYEYTKPSSHIFVCPSVSDSKTGSTYMYNDLAAGRRLADIATPAHSVMVMDGEDTLRNFGHTWTPMEAPQSGGVSFDYPASPIRASISGTVQDAATRHNGGANYGFTDGHVKWQKPENIFFVLRDDYNPSHLDSKGVAHGPDPKDEQLYWAGHYYSATFQIR